MVWLEYQLPKFWYFGTILPVSVDHWTCSIGGNTYDTFSFPFKNWNAFISEDYICTFFKLFIFRAHLNVGSKYSEYYSVKLWRTLDMSILFLKMYLFIKGIFVTFNFNWMISLFSSFIGMWLFGIWNLQFQTIFLGKKII